LQIPYFDQNGVVYFGDLVRRFAFEFAVLTNVFFAISGATATGRISPAVVGRDFRDLPVRESPAMFFEELAQPLP
jgi:hypothetical protein